MLPTFVIGLREGLEAVLIVSILATFLRRNNASLRPMWLGVSAAVLLSVAVGVVLDVVEHALPQREQEGMETVIGLVAVCFVTAMVVWMRTHARFMKRELEGMAQQALSSGTSAAMVAMVFLAVLREGFETSVFLLATFQAASSAFAAALGAVLGIGAAILLGFGIYFGGVRINLGRFFSITSVFLILVAAGLVLSALRTAHEAGWVTLGQGTTVDLSWLAPAGSIRAALITGVLGIPADPRVVEVLGWFCYLVPVTLLTFWPARWRPSEARLPWIRATAAGVLALAAVLLFVAVPRPQASVPASAALRDSGTAHIAVHGSHATLTVERGGSTSRVPLQRSGKAAPAPADATWTGTPPAESLPTTLTAEQLLAYTGGQMPIGVDLTVAPGPYDATWADRSAVTAETYGDGLVAASQTGRLLLTLSGGGLSTPRVITVTGGAPAATDWTLGADAATRSAALSTALQRARDRTLWTHWLPGALLLAAAALLVVAARGRRTAPTPAQSADRSASVRPHDRTAPTAPAR